MTIINRVGVEIEGSWRGATVRIPRLIRDISLSGLERPYGELVSRPMKRIGYLANWIKRFWPTMVNDSCGFHIHVSVDGAGTYSRLMDRQFFDFTIERLKEWGNEYPCKSTAFWDRIAGRNRFCVPQWDADTQSVQRDKDSCRYSALNYCYAQHGTIELRVLPTFKQADTAVSAFQCFLTGIPEYLSNFEAPEVTETAEVDELDLTMEAIDLCA